MVYVHSHPVPQNKISSHEHFSINLSKKPAISNVDSRFFKSKESINSDAYSLAPAPRMLPSPPDAYAFLSITLLGFAG